MRLVGARVEAEQAGHAGPGPALIPAPALPAPPAGHAPRSSPCSRSSASVIRSRPKPRQAVWAVRSVGVDLDPVGLGEVVLVVVEGGDRGRLRARRSAPAPRTSAPARAGCGRAGARCGRRRGRWRRRSAASRPTDAQQLDRAVAPAVAPRGDRLGLADPHDLPLVEHLQPRRVAGGLVAEDVGAAGVDRHAARRQRAARGDRRVDRVAGGRGQARGRSSTGSSLQSSWRAARSSCSAACSSSPSKEKTEPARCGKDFR